MYPHNKKKIGVKYYTKIEEENSYEVLRLLRKKGDSNYIALDDETYEQALVSTKALEEDYYMLKPQGRLVVTFGEVGTAKRLLNLVDVMVSFYEYGSTTPDIVCRQNVIDPYYFMCYGGKPLKFGTAIAKKDCPEWIDFEKLSNEIVNRTDTVIDIYLDDTYEDIKRMIPNVITKADSYCLRSKELNFDALGMHKTLESLLEENGFWDLVDRHFEVYPIPDAIETDSKGIHLHVNQIAAIEKHIDYHIDNIEIIPYWYDIELDMISGDYMLVRDQSKYVWVVKYQKLFPLERKYKGLTEEEIKLFCSVKR